MIVGLTKNQLPTAKMNRNSGRAIRERIPFSAQSVFTLLIVIQLPSLRVRTIFGFPN